jgi:hypothetical protein
MIAKVISTDESIIYNDAIYGYGDEFEVDDAIGKSLIERGLIAGITEIEVEDEEEILDGVEMREDISTMSYPELKSYASKLGISASGTKVELIERIEMYLANLPEAEEAEDAEETNEIPNTSMPE